MACLNRPRSDPCKGCRSFWINRGGCHALGNIGGQKAPSDGLGQRLMENGVQIAYRPGAFGLAELAIELRQVQGG